MTINNKNGLNRHCPVPVNEQEMIVLAHGGGGTMTARLIDTVFKKYFSDKELHQMHDGAVVAAEDASIAVSTDSFVVSPIIFPGGTIGDLAVNGTVNDVAMCGAIPKYLAVSFIIEEGFTIAQLEIIVQSMSAAADRAGVSVITGDTKVVPHGKADQLFITTTGVGLVPRGRRIHHSNIAVGDIVIVSGTIGDHGMAIMSVREGLEFDSEISSDTKALNGLVEAMYGVTSDIHFLRDPTRGGIASTLNEIARMTRLGIRLMEHAIPVSPQVRSACDMLGFDPLYVANEGKLISVVSPQHAETVLAALRRHPDGADAAIIGTITGEHPGMVMLETTIGGKRVVDMMSGEQLPRIC